MVRASHLYAPDPPLDVLVVHPLHLGVDYPVRDVVLAVFAVVVRIRRHLADYDAGHVKPTKPLEEVEKVLPGVLEAREGRPLGGQGLIHVIRQIFYTVGVIQ